jgi:hypothetical protein
MIKISATQLESYRRFIDGLITVEQFERSLLRLDPPNAMMQRGIEFHEMMQTDYPMEFEGKFSTDCILNARNCMDYRSRVFEYKVRRVFRTQFGDISVTGVADQLIGLDVVEIKTKYSTISFDDYYNSLQWRVYCELFNAPYVHYKIFEFNSPEAMDFKNKAEYSFPRPAYNYEYVRNMIHYLHEYILVRGLDKEDVLQLQENTVLI